MPYFNHLMAKSIFDEKTNGKQQISIVESSTSQKKVRTLPGSTATGRTMVSKSANPDTTNKYKSNLSNRKLLFMRSLLCAQIDQLLTASGAYPISQVASLYATYSINYGNLLHESQECKMYEAHNSTTPQFIMMVRIFSTKDLDPQNSLYLKMLRHLGRKHPYIIHTWELFYDENQIYVFQEFVTRGNLVVYLENNNVVDEKQALFWAKQMYRALDFLGDIGIAHRNVAPNHLVIKAMGAETWIKLTGFTNSIIYWNCQQNDVQYCNCWPVAQIQTDGPNFQAPEVYGDPQNEQFDPIVADIWSYGANLYYTLSKQYPYNILQPYENVEDEIWHNINQIEGLSDNGKQFLFSLMRTNANERIPFDFIERHPWFRTPSLGADMIAKTNVKHLVKEKVKTNRSKTKSVAKQPAGESDEPAAAPSKEAPPPAEKVPKSESKAAAGGGPTKSKSSIGSTGSGKSCMSGCLSGCESSATSCDIPGCEECGKCKDCAASQAFDADCKDCAASQAFDDNCKDCIAQKMAEEIEAKKQKSMMKTKKSKSVMVTKSKSEGKLKETKSEGKLKEAKSEGKIKEKEGGAKGKSIGGKSKGAAKSKKSMMKTKKSMSKKSGGKGEKEKGAGGAKKSKSMMKKSKDGGPKKSKSMIKKSKDGGPKKSKSMMKKQGHKSMSKKSMSKKSQAKKTKSKSTIKLKSKSKMNKK